MSTRFRHWALLHYINSVFSLPLKTVQPTHYATVANSNLKLQISALYCSPCIRLLNGNRHFSQQTILACHTRKNTSVINNMTHARILFTCAGFRAFILCMLTRWLCLLGNLNGTEPSVMLLITPVMQLQWQVKMSAVKRRTNIASYDRISLELLCLCFF